MALWQDGKTSCVHTLGKICWKWSKRLVCVGLLSDLFRQNLTSIFHRYSLQLHCFVIEQSFTRTGQLNVFKFQWIKNKISKTSISNGHTSGGKMKRYLWGMRVPCCVGVQAKWSSLDSLITSGGDLLIWQCTPSKPGWHLQMYSLKTSPRLVGVIISHKPSFLQGLGLHGPERGEEEEEEFTAVEDQTEVLLLSPSSLRYLSLSGYRCLRRSHLHKYRWRDRLPPPSHMFLRYDRDSPHSSHLRKNKPLISRIKMHHMLPVSFRLKHFTRFFPVRAGAFFEWEQSDTSSHLDWRILFLNTPNTVSLFMYISLLPWAIQTPHPFYDTSAEKMSCLRTECPRGWHQSFHWVDRFNPNLYPERKMMASFFVSSLLLGHLAWSFFWQQWCYSIGFVAQSAESQILTGSGK